MLSLLPSATVNQTVATLHELELDLATHLGSSTDPTDRLNRWRRWSSRAALVARPYLPPSEIDRVLLGPRFSLLASLDPAAYGPGLDPLVSGEMLARQAELQDALTSLDAEWMRWDQGRASALILDTNVLMEYGERISAVDWGAAVDVLTESLVLAVPVQVVGELDGLKDRGSSEQRAQARRALRWFDERFRDGGLDVPVDGSRAKSPTLRVWVDELHRVPLATVDADILDRATGLLPMVRRLLVVTQDRSMQFRARALGLEAAPLLRTHVPPLDAESRSAASA